VIDVTIIGGGPAGSSAAIRLARLGMRVRLYEKKKFPRPKLCGGFLSPETRASLADLGVLDQVSRIGRPITRMLVTSCFGTSAEAELPAPALSIRREDFDKILLDEARAAGVDVHEGVDGYTRPSASAWLVIASGRGTMSVGERRRAPRDGEFRWLQRWSARPGPAYYGLQAVFEQVEEVTDQVEIDLVPGAYVGMARIDERRVNVCALATQSRMRSEGPVLDDVLKSFSAANPVLASRLRTARRITQWQAAGPVRMGMRRLTEGRRLFVGDAACVVDPFLGEGIAMALHGSHLLAQALNQTEGQTQHYERAWRLNFQEALPVGQLLRSALGNRFGQEVLTASLKRFPSALLWLTERTRPHARSLDLTTS
jgi:flavin-dependent dehydrogenase